MSPMVRAAGSGYLVTETDNVIAVLNNPLGGIGESQWEWMILFPLGGAKIVTLICIDPTC